MTSKIVVALDPASKTGVAVGAPGTSPSLSVVNFAIDADGPEGVFANAMGWIERLLDGGMDHRASKPALLAIEAPIDPSRLFGNTNFDTTLIAIGLSAIFRGAARARDVPIQLVPVNRWRKYVLASGKLKSRDAKLAMIRLCRSLGWGDVSHDAADAAGIWLWATSLTAPKIAIRPEPLFLPQR